MVIQVVQNKMSLSNIGHVPILLHFLDTIVVLNLHIEFEDCTFSRS